MTDSIVWRFITAKGLSTLHKLAHLILSTTLWVKYYYPHSTDGETEALTRCHVSEATGWVSDRARFEAGSAQHVSLCSWSLCHGLQRLWEDGVEKSLGRKRKDRNGGCHQCRDCNHECLGSESGKRGVDRPLLFWTSEDRRIRPSPGVCLSPGLPDLSGLESHQVRTCDGGRGPGMERGVGLLVWTRVKGRKLQQDRWD